MDMFFPTDDEDEPDFAGLVEDDLNDQMIDTLRIAGVDEDTAFNFLCALRAEKVAKLKQATFIELYGQGSTCSEAAKSMPSLNVKGLNAFDLRTRKPNGTPWNFCKRKDRMQARKYIDDHRPDWVIGSPPCTSFCAWNRHMNYPKIDASTVRKRISEGRKHLAFCISIYREQIRRGKHFLHEHPQTAASWQETGIERMSQIPNISIVTADQCMYGLVTPSEGKERKTAPARKTTRFMTSSRQMAAHLQVRCDKGHLHQHLVGGRCAEAAYYPLRLIQAILQGIGDTKDAETLLAAESRDHRSMVNAVSESAGAIPTSDSKSYSSKVPKVKGGNMIVTYSPENFRARYLDEYTGEVLDPELISAAIREELDYFNSKVWQLELKSDMLQKPGHVFVRSRWVLCNKGDLRNPDVRARLVACEINKGGDRPDAFFASTPPLESKRFLFSRLAQEKSRNEVPLRLDFLDVKKAYFNGIPKREVYMQLPRELGLPSHFVAKQVRCVYGTRDAGAIWEDTYRGALEGMGFQSGVGSPCCFWHPTRNISTVVHGDDITSLGIDIDLDWMRVELAKSFELKVRGRIGMGVDGTNDMRILNRVVEVKEDGVTFEADPRHVDILLKSLGLTDANAVRTPGVKETATNYDLVKTNEPDNLIKIDDPNFTTYAVNNQQPDSIVDHSVSHDRVLINSCLKTLKSVKVNKRVHLSGPLHDKTTFHSVIPYSQIYGAHPSILMSTCSGMKYVSTRSDPYTCKGGDVMQERLKSHLKTKNFKFIGGHRKFILENQNLVFSDELQNLLASKFQLVDTGKFDNSVIIHSLLSKNDRRRAFDATGSLSPSAFFLPTTRATLSTAGQG